MDPVILLNQIRSVDTSRLVRRLVVLRAETVRGVDRALLLSLALLEL
ncbi:MAG: type II toxin-antitoxin system PemK/MazF family toxin [Candidatus Rokuibacteriota bacterium]